MPRLGIRRNFYEPILERGARPSQYADAVTTMEDMARHVSKRVLWKHWCYYPSMYWGGLDLLSHYGFEFIALPLTIDEPAVRMGILKARFYNIASMARNAANLEGGLGVTTVTFRGGEVGNSPLLWYSYVMAGEYGWSAGPDMETFGRRFARIMYGDERAYEVLAGISDIDPMPAGEAKRSRAQALLALLAECKGKPLSEPHLDALRRTLRGYVQGP